MDGFAVSAIPHDNAGLLLAGGEAVFHILGPDNVPEAKMTPAARPIPSGGLVYLSEVQRGDSNESRA